MKNKILVIACLVLVLCMSLVLPMATAFADYTEDVLNNPQAIVNFNQYVEDVYTHNYTFNNNINVADLGGSDSSHKYYVRFNFESTVDYVDLFIGNYGIGRRYLPGDNKIIDTYGSNNTFVDLRPSSGVNCNIVNFWMIDLTQMFGVGNEPSLSQCTELFVADYYAYNTGTAISFGGVNSYSQGYTDAVRFVQLQSASSEDFYNTAQSASLLLNNIKYSGALQQRSNQWLELNPTNNADYATFFMPLVIPIPGGTSCTFEYSCYNEAGAGANPNNYFEIFMLVDVEYSSLTGSITRANQVKLATSSKFASSADSSRYTLTFEMPYSCNQIYIATPYVGGTTWFKDCQISFAYYDFEAVRTQQYQSGYKKAEDYYKDLYKVGGSGYQAIYNKGYYDYPNDDHFTFKSLITSAVDVPVQAFTNLFDFDILGVNMKTFYLSVFTLCVIFVVLRLVL